MRLVKHGRLIGLARDRFPRMPVFPGHPAFEVLSYRTPQGIRAAGDRPWGPSNDAGLGYMSEMVMGTTHSGAHIALTRHDHRGGDRWNGGSAQRHLGDFGAAARRHTDPALWRRGVLYDVPATAVRLPGRPEAVSATELEEMEKATGVRAARRVALCARATFGTARPRRDAEHRGPVPTIRPRACGRPRGDRVGSDTETFEVHPRGPGEPANPQPVHTLCSRGGIYIMESLDLEGWPRRAREFLFVALR